MTEKREALRRALSWHIDIWCRRPMEWGIDDCALASANVVRSALGYDPAALFRGKYSTREGAKEALGKLGLGFALRAAAKRHGWQRIRPEAADIGDIGLLIQNGTPITVICKAPGWFIGRGEVGATLIRAVNKATPSMSVRICWAL